MRPTLRNLLHSAFTAFCMLAVSSQASAQLDVTSSTVATDLANALVGEGVIVSDATMDCPNGGAGFFTCVDCNVGITDGILLTSGSVDNAVGPNNQGGATTDNGAPGDPDLDMIPGVIGTNDACVLEFDITVTSDTVRFNYSFGSEEYLEYVGSFNDVFAFYISGPGIVGTENLALVPGTATPVSINNVNDVTNSEYYNINGTGANPPYNSDPYYIQYDGFTTVLTAKRNVVPCETYHLKLAIADDLDWAFDSGVFLEGGSLTSPGVTLDYATDITGYPDVIEGCNDGNLTFTLSFAPIDTFIVNLTLGGTAINGTDYNTLPTELVFLPGDTLLTFPIIAPEDGIAEGVETIVLSVDLGCIAGVGDSLVINIYDAVPLTVSNDTIICPDDMATLTVSGADSYSWSPPETLSNPNGSTTTASPTEPTTYTVTGTLASCVNTAEVFVDIQSPSANAGADTTIYSGEVANLHATGGVDYVWSPTTGLSDPNIANPTAAPETTTTYTVTVTTDIGCVFSDQMTVFVSSDAVVEAPNAFSPNADGSNEVFAMAIRGILASYHLQIFNRWGQLILDTNDATTGWDGTMNNEPQPIGTYVYYVNYTDENGADFSLQGNFVLVR